jgi:hypothetical protein
MPELNWVKDVEITVLRVLLIVTSILMNALCVLIGWGLAQAFVNFAADTFSTRNVSNDGLTLMAVALTVDLSAEHQLLLFMTYLLCTYQSPGYYIYSELFSSPDNSTLPQLQ